MKTSLPMLATRSDQESVELALDLKAMFGDDAVLEAFTDCAYDTALAAERLGIAQRTVQNHIQKRVRPRLVQYLAD